MNAQSYISFPTTALIIQCLVKQQDNFTSLRVQVFGDVMIGTSILGVMINSSQMFAAESRNLLPLLPGQKDNFEEGGIYF